MEKKKKKRRQTALQRQFHNWNGHYMYQHCWVRLIYSFIPKAEHTFVIWYSTMDEECEILPGTCICKPVALESVCFMTLWLLALHKLAMCQSEPAYMPSARDVFTLVSWFTSGMHFWYWCCNHYPLPYFGLSHRLVMEHKTWLLEEPTQDKCVSCVLSLNEWSVHGIRLALVRNTSSAHVLPECWVAFTGL